METLEQLTSAGAELPIDAIPIGERRAQTMRNAAHPELTYWTLKRLSALKNLRITALTAPSRGGGLGRSACHSAYRSTCKPAAQMR